MTTPPYDPNKEPIKVIVREGFEEPQIDLLTLEAEETVKGQIEEVREALTSGEGKRFFDLHTKSTFEVKRIPLKKETHKVARLRELLSASPSAEAWNALMNFINTTELEEEIFSYIEAHLKAWPEELKVVSKSLFSYMPLKPENPCLLFVKKCILTEEDLKDDVFTENLITFMEAVPHLPYIVEGRGEVITGRWCRYGVYLTLKETNEEFFITSRAYDNFIARESRRPRLHYSNFQNPSWRRMDLSGFKTTKEKMAEARERLKRLSPKRRLSLIVKRKRTNKID